MSSEPELITVDPVPTAVVRGVVPVAELAAFFDRSFSMIPAALTEQGATMTGAAFGLYYEPPGETVDLEVGFPLDRNIEVSGDVVPGTLPGGRVARVIHAGAFDGLGEAWGQLLGWITGQGLTPGTIMWESYLTEPSPDMDPRDLRTELNCTLANQ